MWVMMEIPVIKHIKTETCSKNLLEVHKQIEKQVKNQQNAENPHPTPTPTPS